jgi:hypothetical protein
VFSPNEFGRPFLSLRSHAPWLERQPSTLSFPVLVRDTRTSLFFLQFSPHTHSTF